MLNYEWYEFNIIDFHHGKRLFLGSIYECPILRILIKDGVGRISGIVE